MMNTFGIIGTGQMGGAIAKALRERVDGDRILLANRTLKKAQVLAQVLDATAVDNATAAKCSYVILGIQIISFLLMGFIIWRAAVASRRYKELFVDREKSHLITQVEKMREVNNRLTRRNQDLAQKVADLQARLNAQMHQGADQHWFG